MVSRRAQGKREVFLSLGDRGSLTLVTTSLGVWDYGIITGTVAMLFLLVYWIIKNQAKDSARREERAEARENYLLSVNEQLSGAIERHSYALQRHSEILDKQAQLIERQSDVLTKISEQVESISSIVGRLREEVSYMKEDIDRIRRKEDAS